MTNTFSNTIIYNFWKIHSVTIVANQSTLANVRNNKYFREGTITVKVNEAEPDVAVKQTGARKITLTGADLTETVTDYVLKRGTTTVTIEKVAFTTEGNATSVDLTSQASRLISGEYTLQFKENAPLTFTVEASKMDHFEIPSDTLPLDGEYNDADSATVSYHAYNQFGEDITKTVSTVTANTSFGGAEVSPSKGNVKVTFPATSKPMLNATGTIVLVDTSTGINYNKTLTLGMQAKADAIEVLGVYNSATAEPMTLAEGSTNANAVLLVKVSDQYGGDLNYLDCAKEVSFTFSAGQTGMTLPNDVNTNTKFETTIDVDGVSYVAIPLSANNVKAGTAQLFFVSTTTGKNVQATITVGANATVKTFEAAPSAEVYAGQETEFSYTALTEEGTAVTSYDILSEKKYSVDLDTVNANLGSLGKFRWVKNNDGTAKLMFEAAASAVEGISQPSRQVSVPFVTAGYTSTVITFSIQKTPAPADIKTVKPDAILAALSGESITFNVSDFIFEDQYGEPIDGNFVAGYFTNGKSIVVTSDRYSTEAVKEITGSAISGGAITVTMAAIATGSKTTTLTFQIKDTAQITTTNPNGLVGTGCNASVGVAAPSALTGYEIKTNDMVYAPASKSAIGNQTYKFEVFAYLGNRKVQIPADKYEVLTYHVSGDNGATSNGAIMVEVEKGTTAATLSAIDHNYWTAVPTDTSRTVTITVGVTETAISISKTLTASKIAPTATTVSEKLGVSGVTVNGDTVEVYSDKNVGKATEANTVDLAKVLEFKDQYGKPVTSGITVVISNVKTKGTAPTISGNGTATPSFSAGLSANDSYTATVTCERKTVTVNVLVK